MGNHIVILTQNYQALNLMRFENEDEAEETYQRYKKQGYGVLKANVEKAYELNVVNI